MEKQHQHKGMVRSDTGALRSHPVSQSHKDSSVQKEHNKVMGKKAEHVKQIFSRKNIDTDNEIIKDSRKIEHVEKLFEKKAQTEVNEPYMGEYMFIDVDALNNKGVMLKFTRIEVAKENDYEKKVSRGDRIKKTVYLQIDRK